MSEYTNSFKQEGNEIIHTRLLNAPRDLVWEVWTDPEHLKNWWGPEGFTLTNESSNVEPGGAWKFVMHGMGRDFYNEMAYIDVVKPSLISYRHGDGTDGFSFSVVVTFLEVGNDRTFLTMRSIFESEEVIAELNRQVNAIEGGKQTLNKMEKYLAELVKA